MAQNTKRSINELLVSLFNHVMDMEAKAVITVDYSDITNNDMHIIEAIGVEEPRNMSEIAHRLSADYQYERTGEKGLYQKRAQPEGQACCVCNSHGKREKGFLPSQRFS